jgi:TetR/AcrR family transcriptional repressor of nem operon
MVRQSKRADILENGLELVHRQGFSASGVAAIAEAGGAPKGSFYNHFKSKDDFGYAILSRYFEDVKAALDETLRIKTQPAQVRLRNYFVRLRNYNGASHYTRGCLIGNISAEVSSVSEFTRAHLGRLLSDWSRAIAECLEDGQREGTIRDDVVPAVLASLLLDAWQGALLRAKVERSPQSLNIFIDVLLPHLLDKAVVS